MTGMPSPMPMMSINSSDKVSVTGAPRPTENVLHNNNNNNNNYYYYYYMYYYYTYCDYMN